MPGSIAETRPPLNGVFGTTSFRKRLFPRKLQSPENASPLKHVQPCTSTAELGLRESDEYKATDRQSRKWGASPPEAEEPAENLLGGSLLAPPLAPEHARAQARQVKHTILTLAERIEIQLGLSEGATQAHIAARLGRSQGTISTELKRNGGKASYEAVKAHEQASSRQGTARRGRCAIAERPPLRDEVHIRLRRGWSPEEIADQLKLEHPLLKAMHTSHESIYRYVYVVARGALQRELAKCLRRHRRSRKKQKRGTAAKQGKIVDMVLVDARPPEVETRLIAGHFEGDLIQGTMNRSAVGVLVERTTRFIMLCHLKEKDAESVREAFTRRLAAIPAQLRHSLTYDQGKEMAQHKILAADLGLKVYFCHPHSPWERGTCESQNGRIRHYLPKGTDLSKVSPQQLRAYQDMLNERPRKILGGKSPAHCFNELISKYSSN
jgi:transposase, IS30 family